MGNKKNCFFQTYYKSLCSFSQNAASKLEQLLKDPEIISLLDNVSGKRKSDMSWDVVVQRICKYVVLEIDKANSNEALEKKSKVIIFVNSFFFAFYLFELK